MSNSLERVLEQARTRFLRQRPLRAGSLIITLFGDVIAPRGGAVWLGSLIDVLGALGLNEGLVRTAMHRLARDQWFESIRQGRRSEYRLSESGRERIHDAGRRIYAPQGDDWDGEWTLVILGTLQGDTRKRLRRELGWLGFVALSPGLWAHPCPDHEALHTLLHRPESDDGPGCVIARELPGLGQSDIAGLARQGWALQDLEHRFECFLDQFGPVRRALRRRRRLPGESCFLLRILLIHEYRKIVLRDPRLPRALLPDEWPGLPAYELCKELYFLLLNPSEAYVDEHLATVAGQLPEPTPEFHDRFEGLVLTPDLR